MLSELFNKATPSFYSLAHVYRFYLLIVYQNSLNYAKSGERCSSIVEHLLMVQWVIRSIPHEEPIELFLVPAKSKRVACVATAGFLSRYLNGGHI